ncbi:hypothetical protein HDV00_006722 [Rhizophlyctis rosea]|nr:hypothetical protein HDV00_006722 [Rhizophlyctis rosea]
MGGIMKFLEKLVKVFEEEQMEKHRYGIDLFKIQNVCLGVLRGLFGECEELKQLMGPEDIDKDKWVGRMAQCICTALDAPDEVQLYMP